MKKTKFTLLLLAALLAGVCIGFFANSAIIKARIRHFSQIPANLPEHVVERLTDRLKLDEAQQAQVLALMQTYDPRFQEARAQSRAIREAVFGELQAEIDQVLTPEQQAEHKKLIEEMQERRREDRALMRAFPPGPTNAGK